MCTHSSADTSPVQCSLAKLRPVGPMQPSNLFLRGPWTFLSHRENSAKIKFMLKLFKNVHNSFLLSIKDEQKREKMAKKIFSSAVNSIVVIFS